MNTPDPAALGADFDLVPDLSRYNYKTLTLHSTKTGKHYTFTLKTRTFEARGDQPERTVRILTWCAAEPLGMGEVDEGGEVKLWRRAAANIGDKAGQLPNAVIRALRDPLWAYERGVRFELEAVCRVCGRALTHPDSLDLGIGPDCGAELHAELRAVAPERLDDGAKVGEVRGWVDRGRPDLAGAIARRITSPDLRAAALRLTMGR